MIRGVRGATTVNENNKEEIIEATESLLRQIIKENSIDPDMTASVIISVTEDITAVFPAQALRLIDGWKYVPVMCTREIPVEGSLQKCIRVMMHVNTEIPQKEIRHIYLGEAVKLRPDLNLADQSK
jgi:chorismate mutase